MLQTPLRFAATQRVLSIPLPLTVSHTSALNDCDAFRVCVSHLEALAKLAAEENRLPFPQCVLLGPRRWLQICYCQSCQSRSTHVCVITTANTSAATARLAEQTRTCIYADPCAESFACTHAIAQHVWNPMDGSWSCRREHPSASSDSTDLPFLQRPP